MHHSQDSYTSAHYTSHHYTSKDFGKTLPTLTTQIPEKLLHQNVEKEEQVDAISKERRHPVYVVDLPSKTISMTIGHLAAQAKTRTHRHTYETILYILEGAGKTYIEDQVVKWKAGDAVYIPVWAWHHHENETDSLCRYIACENAPLLQNLGNVGIREEKPEGGG